MIRFRYLFPVVLLLAALGVYSTARVMDISVFQLVLKTSSRLGIEGLVIGRATPDPIPEKIARGLAAEIREFATVPPSSNRPPRSKINFLQSAHDGSGRLFVNDLRGRIFVVSRGQLAAKPFFDAKRAFGDRFLEKNLEIGLSSFAFDPDHSKPNAPGHRKFYTVHSERPTGEAAGNTPTFRSPTGKVHHVSVISEWRTDVLDTGVVDYYSQRELMRIEQHSYDHNVGQIGFNSGAAEGDPDYGLLYIAVGDGGDTSTASNGGSVDIYRLAQSTAVPFGKILRINPLNLRGPGYTIPTDNPYVDADGYLPEIWAYGLRNPQRFSWDSGGRQQMLIADIGQANIEEVNIGVAGANYGWSEYEGGFLVNHDNQNELFALLLPELLSGVRKPVAQYDHDEGKAIAGGHVYRGTRIPQLYGMYVFGDIVNGRIFYFDIDELAGGEAAELFELSLIHNGEERSLLDILGAGRADLRLAVDDAGEIYVLTKYDGVIRTLHAVGNR